MCTELSILGGLSARIFVTYYASTANPHHLPPGSVDMIGQTDQPNHQNIGNWAEVRKYYVRT
jgi:hypothetical protein